uniref:Selenocysteine lyase n=1 Tax=Sinocyclocheilus grahami TaxID=75366 RepID=A0A672SUZ3_SINGR
YIGSSGLSQLNMKSFAFDLSHAPECSLQNSFVCCRIYMDYNATTPVDPEVVRVITDALTDAWGNPSSNYLPGLKARDIIYHSRDTIARMVGGKAEDIIFTSGGTEANNLVFHTAVEHFRKSKTSAQGDTNSKQLNGRGSLPHIIISSVEHDPIKLTAKHLLKEDLCGLIGPDWVLVVDVTFVPISKVTARVEVEDVIAAICPTTCLVSIMLANNETGIIMPIKDICQRVREVNKQRAASAPRILLHTDAAQKIRDGNPVDGMFQFYGPRIGALFVNDPGTTTPVYPLFFGGGQERNFRPGYDMVYCMVGFCMDDELLNRIKTSMLLILKSILLLSLYFSELRTHTWKILNVFCGNLVMCSHFLRPSHILLSCGIPYHVATNALRISVGRCTSREDVDIVVEDLRDTVEQLERMN